MPPLASTTRIVGDPLCTATTGRTSLTSAEEQGGIDDPRSRQPASLRAQLSSLSPSRTRAACAFGPLALGQSGARMDSWARYIEGTMTPSRALPSLVSVRSVSTITDLNVDDGGTDRAS